MSDSSANSSGPTENSPLKEVSPESLELIWSKDPNNYTVQDVERIVDKLVADRQRFLLEPEKVKRQRGKSADTSGIKSIEDLGL